MGTVKQTKRNRAVYQEIDGVKHKLCTGPSHRVGKFIPVDNFYVRGNGVIRPWCKFCEGSGKGTEPMVRYKNVQFAVDELISRLGKAETARRIEIKYGTLWAWLHGQREYVHRRTARRIIRALIFARSRKEVRHRLSIRHGSNMRGHRERVV